MLSKYFSSAAICSFQARDKILCNIMFYWTKKKYTHKQQNFKEKYTIQMWLI